LELARLSTLAGSVSADRKPIHSPFQQVLNPLLRARNRRRKRQGRSLKRSQPLIRSRMWS
jgi:hypothetical protein